ncbi:MAG: hypothetical protein E5Y08_31230, partial [Mesorhizobium sp.]
MDMPGSFAPPSVLPGISPTRGEIGSHLRFRQFSTSQEERRSGDLPICPPVGGMSGRTEGGAVERYHLLLALLSA